MFPLQLWKSHTICGGNFTFWNAKECLKDYHLLKPGFHIIAGVTRIAEKWTQQPQRLSGTNWFILPVTLSDPGDLGDSVAVIAEVLSRKPSATHDRVHSRKYLKETYQQPTSTFTDCQRMPSDLMDTNSHWDRWTHFSATMTIPATSATL